VTPFGVLYALIHFALFATGLVLAIALLSPRDPRAGRLTAYGFGCEIAALVVWIAGDLLTAAAGTGAVIAVADNALARVTEVAGYVLILLGLLRRVRALQGARRAES
jgi:lipopolysaccharide export LptBFGC system permease protein LptF